MGVWCYRSCGAGNEGFWYVTDVVGRFSRSAGGSCEDAGSWKGRRACPLTKSSRLNVDDTNKQKPSIRPHPISLANSTQGHTYTHTSGSAKWFDIGYLCFLVLFLFWKKKKLIKWAAGVCVCKILAPPPINFQTSYPIDTKFWLDIESYRNSPTPLIPFLNFENCAREKFMKFIFLHLINMGKFSISYTPLIYDSDDWNLVYR